MTSDQKTSGGSIPFTKLVESLPAAIPFVGPETIERREEMIFRARMGANESAFGISPLAREAMARAVSETAWYGDPEGFELRQALAEKHGVAMEEICLCAGIDEVLGNIVRMVVEPGAPVVTSLGAYPTFNYHVAGFGGRLVTVPYKEDREDPDGLLEAVRRENPPLVYLANPDNPMGTWHSAERLTAFIEALPQDCLFAYDEAYIEFAPEGVEAPIDTSDPRVIRMRTFSKAHGMAGARIGYVIAHRDLVTGLNKIRNHFGISRVAQAGALASLRDEAFLAKVIGAVEEGRRELSALAQSLGLTALPSATNFVTIDVGGGDRARAILKALEARQVFIRMPGVAPLDRCIRVSVGRPDEMKVFAEEFRAVLQEVGAT